MVQHPRDAFSRTGKVVSIGLLLAMVYIAGMVGGDDKCSVIIECLTHYHWIAR